MSSFNCAVKNGVVNTAGLDEQWDLQDTGVGAGGQGHSCPQVGLFRACSWDSRTALPACLASAKPWFGSQVRKWHVYVHVHVCLVFYLEKKTRFYSWNCHKVIDLLWLTVQPEWGSWCMPLKSVRAFCVFPHHSGQTMESSVIGWAVLISKHEISVRVTVLWCQFEANLHFYIIIELT